MARLVGGSAPGWKFGQGVRGRGRGVGTGASAGGCHALAAPNGAFAGGCNFGSPNAACVRPDQVPLPAAAPSERPNPVPLPAAAPTGNTTSPQVNQTRTPQPHTTTP